MKNILNTLLKRNAAEKRILYEDKKILHSSGHSKRNYAVSITKPKSARFKIYYTLLIRKCQ